MRMSMKTVLVVIVVVVVAAVTFREASGRVLDWLKAMHGGGPAAHGTK